MTSPQTEDGFTKIANELLEAICRHKFTAREYAVVLAVIRRTYGFNKKFDRLALSQLANMTGISKGNLSETLTRLEKARVLFLKREQGKLQTIGFNKNYGEWQLFPKQEQRPTVPDLERTVPESGTKLFPNQEQQKKEINITKESTSPVGIRKYIEQCKTQGVEAIPLADPVFEYATKTGIPHDFLELCWREFVDRNTQSGKRYKHWRQAFRNCVRANWYRLWWVQPDGTYALTTTGAQAKKHKEAANG